MNSAISILILLFAIRPESLPPQRNCELWRGTASGNDPSVEVQLQLCPGEGGALTGTLQWSSTVSGWNRRMVRGNYNNVEKTALILHDLSFIEAAPTSPWMFCLIDRYELTRQGDSLTGRYESKKCHDYASLTLQRITDATSNKN